MKRRSAMLVLLAALLCLGCNSSPDPVPAEAPPMLDTSTLPTVVLASGEKIVVEVAANDVTRARGLMFRDRVETGHGMLFVFPATGVYPFWMKNTLVPLDMIWIDQGGKVVHVKEGVPPCKADPCPSYSPEVEAKYVLELGSGQARARRIQTGDVLQFINIQNYVAR